MQWAELGCLHTSIESRTTADREEGMTLRRREFQSGSSTGGRSLPSGMNRMERELTQ
jgi:hypothetical protein